MQGRLRQVSTGGKGIYVGVNADTNVYQWVNGVWRDLNFHEAVWASIGHDGTIWVVHRRNLVFKRMNGYWQQMSATCKQVYVSHADSIACVNPVGGVYFYDSREIYPISVPFGVTD